MKVSDLMTTEVVSVSPETSLREAAMMLVRHGISGMPVVSPSGEVLGVLSEGDVVTKAGGKVARSGLLGWLFEPADDEYKIAAENVGEAMTAPAVTIGPARPIHEAAKAMVTEAVNRLPVVLDGKLVGILTRADIVRAFARSDAEIATEIRDEILRRTFWLEPGSVTVAIADGHVTLTGQVETNVEVEMLQTFVARVPGVVSVASDLHYRTKVA